MTRAARTTPPPPRRALALLGALGLALGVAVIFFTLGAVLAGETRHTDEPLPASVLRAVPESSYTVPRRYTGSVQPRRASRVGFELAGLVTSVSIDDGRHVAAGEEIARLDTARLEARRAELLAARAEARANAELAQATYDRTLEAHQMTAASIQELDDAEEARDAALAALERTERAIESIDVDLAKSVITAPFDAVVARRFIDEGQVIQPGEPVAELLEREAPEARIGLPPKAAQSLSPGDRVRVEVRAQPLTGTLRELLPVTDPGTRTVEALIVLDAQLDGIRRGDLASIRVERTIEQPGFWLPLDALTESARGLWSCFVIDAARDGALTVEQRQLEVLHTDGTRAYVTGTLQPDELVVRSGLHRIVPGDRVTIDSSGRGTDG